MLAARKKCAERNFVRNLLGHGSIASAMSNYTIADDFAYLQPSFFARLLVVGGAAAFLTSWFAPLVQGFSPSGSGVPMLWPFYAAGVVALVGALAPRRCAPLALLGLRIAMLPITLVTIFHAFSSGGVYSFLLIIGLIINCLRVTGGFQRDSRFVPLMIISITMVAALIVLPLFTVSIVTVGIGAKLLLGGLVAMMLGGFMWRVAAPNFEQLLADELEPTQS